MRRPLLLCLVPLLLAAACGRPEDANEPVPDAPVTLTRSGGCGDAYLWAATDDGTIAITVAVDARERSTAEPTTIAVDLPDADIEAFVLRGDRDVTPSLCTDVVDGDAEPDEILPLTAGSGEIVLDPAAEGGPDAACGETSVSARLTGLAAEDGMPFTEVTITTDDIGCYAG